MRECISCSKREKEWGHFLPAPTKLIYLSEVNSAMCKREPLHQAHPLSPHAQQAHLHQGNFTWETEQQVSFSEDQCETLIHTKSADYRVL